MAKNAKPILDGPLWTILILLFITLALGITAYVPTWHGSTRALLRVLFWTVACLSVILIPLATRSRKEHQSSS